MTNGIYFNMSDMYPDYQGRNTDDKTIAEPEEKEPLGEDTQEADSRVVSNKTFFLCILVIILLVTFFGVSQ